MARIRTQDKDSPDGSGGADRNLSEERARPPVTDPDDDEFTAGLFDEPAERAGSEPPGENRLESDAEARAGSGRPRARRKKAVQPRQGTMGLRRARKPPPAEPGPAETEPVEPARSKPQEEGSPPPVPAAEEDEKGRKTGRRRRRRDRASVPASDGDSPPAGGTKGSGVAEDEVPVSLPEWVEEEPEEQDFPRSKKSRRDLMPAGRGIEPSPGERDEVQPTSEPVHKRILINANDPEEVRIAVLENGRLEELYYERPSEKKYLGNIYRARIVNLEPAIQAAFVDLGIGRNGFLHVSDVLPAYREATGIPFDSMSVRCPDRRRLKIQDILRRGQEVLVQITKDAIGAKGPSLTTYVSVPGKYLVLMPGVNRHGVSKRIQDGDERAKLREDLGQLDLPRGMGYIVRTAGRDRPRSDLEKDLQYLMRVWEEIRANVESRSLPALVYEESDLVIRAMRDFFRTDVDEILVDALAVAERAKKFLVDVMPQSSGRLKHYGGTSPIFSRFGVEEQIEKIYNRRVPLPSGGHIVLEQTEALVAIDVNSGKYRDEEDLEATALKTNLEAAQEIARQLRLRDLGGVIVNDFIDMESESNRRAVERALRAALKRDRAKSWISRISRFGIIEMTRQRVRPSFERSNHEPCRFCRGTGVVKSARSLGITILRQIRSSLGSRRRSVCEVVAHPGVVDYLLNDRRSDLVALESQYGRTILVKADPDFGQEQYAVRYR